MTPLRRRMLEDMGIRNFAENTQLCYLQQVSTYARYFGRSPEDLGAEDVRAYPVHLIEVRKLSPASVGLAACALRFLYRVTLKRDWDFDDIPLPRKPFRLPVILGRRKWCGCWSRSTVRQASLRAARGPRPDRSTSVS